MDLDSSDYLHVSVCCINVGGLGIVVAAPVHSYQALEPVSPVVFKLWGAPPLGGARVLQGGGKNSGKKP